LSDVCLHCCFAIIADATEALRRAESGSVTEEYMWLSDVCLHCCFAIIADATEALRRAESGSVTDSVKVATIRGAMRLQRKVRVLLECVLICVFSSYVRH